MHGVVNISNYQEHGLGKESLVTTTSYESSALTTVAATKVTIFRAKAATQILEPNQLDDGEEADDTSHA